jgi:hypothetical protein
LEGGVMTILIRADIALPALDHTEPTYPTEGSCSKRPGCHGPHTEQGETCPGCGIQFGQGVAA